MLTISLLLSTHIPSFFFCFFFSLPGGQLEKLMDDLHTELSSNPPLPGSYTARKGDLCAALFVDNNWYVSNSPPPPPLTPLDFFWCWSVRC